MKEIITLPAKSVKVKKSSAGLGLYATVDIPKKTWIIEYIGTKKLNKDIEDDTTKYLFEINNRWTIDGATRKNTARYINHGCKGNAEPEIRGHQVYIRAIKNIKVGDEITYDYGKEYFNTFIKPYGCRCVSCIAKKKLENKK